jgi:serine/threonine-protein kinase
VPTGTEPPRGLSLRTRLFLGSLALVAFTIGTSVAYLSSRAQTIADQTIRQDLRAVPAIFEGWRSAEAASRERAVRSLADEVGTRALLAEVRDNPETFHEATRDFADVLGARAVLLFDPSGALLARSDREAGDGLGQDFSGIAWVDAPRLRRQPLTAFILETSSEPPALSIVASVPVTQGAGREERLNGVLAATFALSDGTALDLSRVSSAETLFAGNVAPRNAPPSPRGLASTGRFAGSLPASLAPALSALFTSGESADALEFDLGGEAFIATAVPVKSGGGETIGAFVAARSVEVEMAPFLEIRRSLIGVGLVALALALPASFVLAQGLAGPIQRLADGARKIARGELDVSLPAATGEVGALARAFESMVGELREKAVLEALVGRLQRRPGDITFRGVASQPAAAPASADVGQVIAGRYEVLSKLGIGGMGVVFRARDRELDEEVALKILKGGEAQGPLAERLRQEIKLARAITHPNVVRAFDLGESEGARFLSMEYVAGTTLREVIDAKGALDLTPALQIAKQVCRGLSAVHKAGIIHGDLKPSNVMVMGSGVAKLMDFGVARFRAEQDAAGVSIVGTPLYMSPEQVKGADLDERSDIYSLGVVTFEMFTGRCPFRANQIGEIMQMHLDDPPPDPRSIRAEVPEALAQIILSCLSKHRLQRPASAADLDRLLMRVRV